jgi:hypothetical protein
MGDFEVDPHVLKDVMLGLIAAPLAIDGQGGSALLKWPPEGIHTRHG